LKAFHDAGFGWALWDFEGPTGIFNSDRLDISYENYEGRQLDRTMLDLLQRY
jgi:endoglucanase